MKGGYNAKTFEDENYEEYVNKLQTLAHHIFDTDENVNYGIGNEDIKIIKEYMQKYAKVYHLNYNVAFDKLVDLTDNFTSESFVTELRFDGLSCKNMGIKPESYEEFVIYYMRILSQDPGRFDLTMEELADNESYNSDISYNVYIYDMCYVLKEDACLTWAICEHTSRDFRSDALKKYNNPSGLVGNSNLLSFPTEEAGIIETILQIKKYHSMGAEEISDFADFYCPVGDTEESKQLNQEWTEDITYLYEYAEDDVMYDISWSKAFNDVFSKH